MGVWGTGLYSGDFAMDLRTTVAALLRLPFDPERIVDIACDTEPAAANDPADEEHTTFWLVIADQFAKRGVSSDRVRNIALTILDSGRDAATLESLGMKPADIRRRRQMLDELRERINAAPSAVKSRKTLRAPQPLLMETGDILVYPTCRGKCINPYFPSKEQDIQYTKSGPSPWKQDGWAAMVVIDHGRAFDFLSWYRTMTIALASIDKPSLESLRRGDVMWRLALPGTCLASHFKKMKLEKVGTLAIDREKLKQLFPEIKPGVSAAVQDISIANYMAAVPSVPLSAIPKPGEPAKGRARTLLGIEQILQGSDPL
jgi:hypothetical protein